MMVLAWGIDPDTARTLGFDANGIDALDGFVFPDSDEGWILIGDGATVEEVGRIAGLLAEHRGRWTALLFRDGEFRPLTSGRSLSPESALHLIATHPGVLSLGHAAPVLARLRHDLNNALAVALAEVQLLRMDAEGDGWREPGNPDEGGLPVVEEQLNRIRALVTGLEPWRIS